MDAGRGIVVIILDFGTTRCIRNLVTASNATPLYDLGEVEAAVSVIERVLCVGRSPCRGYCYRKDKPMEPGDLPESSVLQISGSIE